jgi:hypothetical protein
MGIKQYNTGKEPGSVPGSWSIMVSLSELLTHPGIAPPPLPLLPSLLQGDGNVQRVWEQSP